MIISIMLFFFNDTAPTEIYTLSLHDALPISAVAQKAAAQEQSKIGATRARADIESAAAKTNQAQDRKSTRLNSSHLGISYAVFCLKKKKKTNRRISRETIIGTKEAPPDI